MLFWLKTIFCSTQMLDVNLLSELENTSDILKAFGKKELCENEETQQKNQELTKTEDKNFYENQSNSNILDDLINFIDESFNNGYNNVDYKLSDKMLSMTSESNFIAQNSISNQHITLKRDKQFCIIKQPKNNTAEHSHRNAFCKNTTNMLLRSTKNDLLQEQYINQENNTSLQKFNNVTVLSDHQSCHGETNCINKPDNSQINKLSNVIDSSIKKPKNSKYSSSAYKNKKNVKIKKKKSKTDNIIPNIRKYNIVETLESKNKNNHNRIYLADIFTANERKLYKKYKQSERDFRKFCKSNINKKILQFIEKIEISNLSNNLKHRSILALSNLSSFLDTINPITTNAAQAPMQDFVDSLNLAYKKFKGYAVVSENLFIFKSKFKSLHMVGNEYICSSSCTFCKIRKLSKSFNKRFNSFYKKLLEFKKVLKKKI